MNEATKLRKSDTWLVGIIRDDPEDGGHTWSVLGVYDDEDEAAAVCTTGDHFVGPLVMNENAENLDSGDLGKGYIKSPWPGLWFPTAGANPWTEELIQKEKYPLSPGLDKRGWLSP